MITRQWGFPRLYQVNPMRRDSKVGLIHVKIVDNVPHVWPVARPGGTYVNSSNTPHNLHVPVRNQAPQNRIIRSTGPAFTPLRPNVAMDPSDSRTWQRPYRFTN